MARHRLPVRTSSQEKYSADEEHLAGRDSE